MILVFWFTWSNEMQVVSLDLSKYYFLLFYLIVEFIIFIWHIKFDLVANMLLF